MEKPVFYKDSTLILQGTIILGILILMYRNILPVMFKLWSTPAYSHSYIIPFIFGYFIWEKREGLNKAVIKPTKYGLLFLILSVLFFITGRLGAERFISSFSLILIVAALVYYHLGAEIFRIISFPLSLFIFTVPIPNIIFHKLSFTLQLFSSEFAVRFMQLFALPVYNEGNVIHLFYTDLEVAEACSGIHSIISLVTLSVIFSYYFQKKIRIRLFLILSSIPIAIFTNAFRVAGTGMLAHFWSIKIATGFFHEFSGWLIFVIAFIILISENLLLNIIIRRLKLS